MITYTCNRCGVSQEDGKPFPNVVKPLSDKRVNLCPDCQKKYDEYINSCWQGVDKKMEDWLNQSTRSGE